MSSRKKARALRSPVRVMTQEKMTLEEWLALPECPLHEADREKTKRRAERSTDLHRFHPLHTGVVAAKTRDGRMYRITGFRQAYVWSHALSDRTPKTVDVSVFHVRNVEEVNARYRGFNS